MLGAIGRGLMGIGRAAARTGKAGGHLGVDMVKGQKGWFGKASVPLFVGLPVIGTIPFLGPKVRETLPGGEFLAHDMFGTSTPGATGSYAQSRPLAGTIKRNALPLPTGGPTTRGITDPKVTRMKDVYGNPMATVKAAHALKEKIASPASVLSKITPGQALALGGAASVGTALGSHLLSGALNRLDSLRRDAGRQTNLNKTMRVLHAVNPEIQDSPQARAKAKALFNIVHRTSPYVAREPVVAASVINTMLASPQELPTPDAFKSLAELQHKLEEAKAVRPIRAGYSVSGSDLAGALVGSDG